MLIMRQFRSYRPHPRQIQRRGESGPEMEKRRSPLCLCTCKNQCLSLNPTNGRYEGSGRWVPRSTRDNHVRDDKRGRRQSQMQHLLLDHTVATYPTQVADPVKEDNESVARLQDEFLLLSSCPTTSTNKPLIFVNSPISNGEFVTTKFPKILEPNSGKYALRSDRHINQVFIMTENRCCTIYASLQVMENSRDSRDALMQDVVDHLVYLDQQKGYQWAQYRIGQAPRGMPTPNNEARLPLIINSGNYPHTHYNFK
jgi:hypothetical protein